MARKRKTMKKKYRKKRGGNHPEQNKIYVIATACLFNDEQRRTDEYIRGVKKMMELTKDIPNLKIIIVENNGKRPTFFDTLGPEVLYTDNNKRDEDKGIKELRDVLQCIEHYKIKDRDFIVKFTARYLPADDSPFIKALPDFDKNNFDCFVKYGSAWDHKTDHSVDNCNLGLFGMRCEYVKKIQFADNSNGVIPMEWKWAEVARDLIDKSKINVFRYLGLNVRVGGAQEFWLT
jgi:hypothetical protein